MTTGALRDLATDRRTAIRFEIVGRLHGSLAARPSVRLVNISRGGALIEAPWSLLPDSVHAVEIDSDRHLLSVDARVCHVRQGYTGSNFMIGLEFLALDEALAAQMDRFVLRHPFSNGQPA